MTRKVNVPLGLTGMECLPGNGLFRAGSIGMSLHPDSQEMGNPREKCCEDALIFRSVSIGQAEDSGQ